MLNLKLEHWMVTPNKLPSPSATDWAKVLYGTHYKQALGAAPQPLPRLVRLDWLKELWEYYLDAWEREGRYL